MFVPAIQVAQCTAHSQTFWEPRKQLPRKTTEVTMFQFRGPIGAGPHIYVWAVSKDTGAHSSTRGKKVPCHRFSLPKSLLPVTRFLNGSLFRDPDLYLETRISIAYLILSLKSKVILWKPIWNVRNIYLGIARLGGPDQTRPDQTRPENVSTEIFEMNAFVGSKSLYCLNKGTSYLLWDCWSFDTYKVCICRGEGFELYEGWNFWDLPLS